MVNNVSRRTFMAGLSTVAVLSVLPQNALALTTDQARTLIDRLVGEINRIINSGASEANMLREFEGVFDRYANTEIIAHRVLGADARSLSRNQLNTFIDAFGGYIARKYGRRFREFIGGEITVKRAVAIKSWHEVETTVKLRGEPPFEVVFMVKDAGGRDLFFDMEIEGISLTRVEREEIGSMFDARGRDIDRLSRDLRNLG